MSSDSDIKTHYPNARLCHVIKSDNFEGYGFNLHAEKGKAGQYIGKVDEGSPAELAGLRQGDRILEVNGVSIANETHKQVVQRIKANPNETKLYVIDPEEDVNNDNGNSPSAITDTNSNSSTKTASDATTASANNGQAHTGGIGTENDHARNDNNMNNGNANNTNGNSNNANNSNGNTNTNNTNASLNLSMSAAELRAKLAAKKKYDPRKESIDFKKKFDTVQKL